MAKKKSLIDKMRTQLRKNEEKKNLEIKKNKIIFEEEEKKKKKITKALVIYQTPY